MKIAIIGLGRVAEIHANALREIDPELFAGGWNRTESRAREFCSRFGGQAYSSIDELLSDTSVNAILVATSTSYHFEFAKQALLAGKHVLLEKPLCEEEGQIRELADIARSMSRICMPSHNYIYAQDVQRLHAHVKAGRLGRIVSYWAMFNKRHPASIGESDLTMRELMIHHTYSMLYLVGRPSHVVATGTNVHFDNKEAHDQLLITAQFPDGAVANLWGSFSADDQSREPWSLCFKILGSEGSGIVPWGVVKYGSASEPFWDDASYRDSFFHIQNFFLKECVAKNASPLSTLDDAHDAARILNAARKSLAEGRRISIDYDP